MRNHLPVVLFISAVIIVPATAQEPASTDSAKVARVETAVGSSIAGRQLAGTADSFSSTAGTLYCYSKIANAADTKVEHVWYRGETVMNRVRLNIRGSPWRTWSSKKMGAGSTGNWRCDVLQNGKVLQSVKFKVE